MYEKMWEGTVSGWDLSLDFDGDTGLFRYRAGNGGGELKVSVCANPLDAGLMDGPGVAWSPTEPPLIPEGPLDLEGRFAPFRTPDEVVASTWPTLADWPRERKAATVAELPGCMYRLSMSRIGNFHDGTGIPDYIAEFSLINCSRTLNAMYGGPEGWPREALDALFGKESLLVRKSLDYIDPFLKGDPRDIPPEVVALARSSASVDGSMAPSYRDAVVALAERVCGPGRKAPHYFAVGTSVNPDVFLNEIARGNRVSVALEARFGSPAGPALNLGSTAVSLDARDAERIRGDLTDALANADIYRKLYGTQNRPGKGTTPGNEGTIGLTELVSIIHAAGNHEMFSRQRVEMPQLGYDLNLDGPGVRVLIACGMSEWYSDDAQEWQTVSWSKSDRAYHVERIDSHLVSGEPHGIDRTETGSSDFYPAVAVQEILDGHRSLVEAEAARPHPFLNARFAADPRGLLEGIRGTVVEKSSAPGTKALKEGLDRLQGAKSHKAPTHDLRPGYFTY